jgi:hypothetical protein
MNRIAAIALVVAGVLSTGYAQRGASHGGFSSHGGQMPHGFIGPVPSRPSGSFSGDRTRGTNDGYRPGYNGNSGRTGERGGYYRYRNPYAPYAIVIPYAMTPWTGWDGTPDNGEYGAAPAPGDVAGGYGAPPYDQPGPQGPNDGQVQGPQQGLSAQVPYRIPYQGASEPQPPSSDSDDAITLIFKDGRPPEQIHNYILSRTTLYVQDKRPHSIPIEQLDIAATGKANLDAGIEFRLPVANP